MTDFKEIERLYQQYFNIEKEIKSFIDEENYEDATSKVETRNAIINRISNARKTAKNLSQEEILQLSSYDKSISEQNKNIINLLKKEKNELDSTIKNTNKKVKINNAYSSQTTQKQGVFLDMEE